MKSDNGLYKLIYESVSYTHLDVYKRQERERTLQNEAYRDFLTGLLNRRGLEASVEALHKEDCPLAVYLFDLDNLKYINDSFGHGEGDRMLMKLSLIHIYCWARTVRRS